MIYGYVRVSSINQKIDRQVEELHRFGLSNKEIYIDKQFSKRF